MLLVLTAAFAQPHMLLSEVCRLRGVQANALPSSLIAFHLKFFMTQTSRWMHGWQSQFETIFHLHELTLK